MRKMEKKVESENQKLEQKLSHLKTRENRLKNNTESQKSM